MNNNSLAYKSSKIIFNDPTYSDIKFTFPHLKTEEIVYGHVTVLSIECPKLIPKRKGFFVSKPKLGEISVAIDDVSLEAFTEFLRYIYFGFCNKKYLYFDELVSLAIKFEKLKFQKYLCEEYMTWLHVGNALKALQVRIEFTIYFCQIVKWKLTDFFFRYATQAVTILNM